MFRSKLFWWTTLAVAIATLNYAGRLAAEPLEDGELELLYRYSTAASNAVYFLFLLGVVLLIAGSQRRLLALRPPRSWPVAAGLAAMLLAAIVAAVIALEPVLGGGEEQGLVPKEWRPEHAGAYAASFVVVALLGPFVEELIYRGLGFSLLERLGPWAAILLTGFAFAAAHGLVRAFPALFLMGCGLAWLRWRTDSVYPCIALHSLYNAAALLVVFAR